MYSNETSGRNKYKLYNTWRYIWVKEMSWDCLENAEKKKDV